MFLEASLDKRSLFSNKPTELVAKLNIFLDGGVQESIEFLNRFGKRLGWRLGLCGSCSGGRRSDRRGVGRRGNRLVQNSGIGGRFGGRGDIFKARGCSLKAKVKSVPVQSTRTAQWA